MPIQIAKIAKVLGSFRLKPNLEEQDDSEFFFQW